MKLVTVLAPILMLVGCANGAILGPEKTGKPNESFISVNLSDSEHVFLKPLDANGRDYQRLHGPGIWVSGGWFMVEYFCDSPRNHPGRIIIDEDGEDDSINITGGHSYALQCDADVPFVLHVFDQGELTNQR